MSAGHDVRWEDLVNELPTGEALTNRQLIEDFRRNAENKSDETVSKYVLGIEEFAEWFAQPLVAARPRVVQDYLTYLKLDRPRVLETREDRVAGPYSCGRSSSTARTGRWLQAAARATSPRSGSSTG